MALLVTLLACAGMVLLLAGEKLPDPQPYPAQAGQPPAACAPGITNPALMLDLIAAMLAAGRPLGATLEVLAELADPATGAAAKRLAAGLGMGLPWEEAWALAAGEDATGDAADRASDARGQRSVSGALPALRFALAYAAGSGAPAAKVLLAQSGQLRRQRMRSQEAAAAVLGVRLVLPLGLCTLPAFVALTVLPLVLALLPAMG